MRTKYLLFALIIVFGINPTELLAQPPQFFNGNTGNSSNAFPLSTTTSNKVQWIYGPASFTSLGGGLGAPATPGTIQKIYFRMGAGTSATANYNIFIRLGQNVGTILGFPNTTYTTGLTQAFADPVFNFTGVLPNQWYGIELQTPVFYDPTLSLIFEMEQTGGTGNQLSQSNLVTNARRWGAFGSAVGTGFGTGLVDFGIDLKQDTFYHCSGGAPITLATGNTGNITWNVDFGSATLSGTTGTTITALPAALSQVTASSDANSIIDTFVLVPVTGELDAGADKTVTGCAPFTDGLSATFIDTTANVDYNIAWTPLINITAGGTTLTPSITQNILTKYIVTITTSVENGSCTFVDSTEVDVDDFTPVANFNAIRTLGCINDTVDFVNLTTLNPAGSPTYFWTFGDGNFSTDPSPRHIYGVQNSYMVNLLVTDNGCTHDTTFTVDVRHPLDTDFLITNTGTAGDDSICIGSQFIFSPATIPLAGTGNMTFDWDFGDGNQRLGQNGAQQVYGYTTPGTYTVKLIITDTIGCQDSASYDVFVDIAAHINVTATPTTICVGDQVYFTDSISANTITSAYDFGDGTILRDIHNPTHTYETPGTYIANFSGVYLVCANRDTNITIQVNNYPLVNLGDDLTLCPGLDTAVVLEDVDNPAQILTWSTGETAPSITINSEGTGRYSASADNSGCMSTDSIWVKRDCYLNIPNSFSPNGDGRNDYFIPRNLLSSGVVAFDMKIMNRWGEVIFRGTSADGRGWDGMYGGKEQAIGVYVYVIEATWKNGFTNNFQGNVTLMR